MQVRPLVPGDVSEAAIVLGRAFWDYPESIHLLPDERRRARVLPRFLGSDCHDSLRFGLVLGAFAEDPSAVLGVAIWLPPEAYPIPLGRQIRQVASLAPILPWAIGLIPEALRGREVMRERHPKEPHFYLSTLGVDGLHQRSGVGSALVQPVLDRADREGLGCYLTTALEANVGWYARFGFEVREELSPTDRWPTVWRLWRDPADRSAGPVPPDF